MEKVRVFIKARKNNTMFFARASIGDYTFPDMLVYNPSNGANGKAGQLA